MTPQERGKRAAAKAAAALIQNGQTIGVGTGSTAEFFIDYLSERIKNEKLSIKGVATSKKSFEKSSSAGIELIDPNKIKTLDLCVDGADEIDPQNRMVKGGGGALLREKIIANTASQMIVIVDESKCVTHFGKFPLALEILPFAHLATGYTLEKKGFKGSFRKKENGSFFLTDNNNLIFDIQLDYPLKNPEELNKELKNIPGVLETGFFFHLAKQVIVGYPNGEVKIIVA
jgi:ribose 5-phosphate isomerase A